MDGHNLCMSLLAERELPVYKLYTSCVLFATLALGG